MTEEIITFDVVYNVRNIDSSIRQTQRMLLFTNALRLSIVDIQRVMSGPTIANVLFTGIQLTRVWTTLLRVIRATNQAQRIGLSQGVLGRAVGGRGAAAAARAFGAGQGILQFGAGGTLGVGSAQAATGGGFGVALSAFVAANPAVAAALIGGAIIATSVGLDIRSRRLQEEFLQRSREVAKSQGLEN